VAAPTFDDGDAADQLGKAFPGAFPCRSRWWCFFDLRADLLHTAFDVRGPCPAPSMIVVLSLSMVIFLARPRSSKLHILELDAEVFGDGLAARKGGDVFEHGLAAVAKARGLDGSALQACRGACSPRGWPALRLPRPQRMIKRGLPILAVCSSSGSRSFIELIFFS